MKAKKWITNNFGLKLVSLILAIATWLYISLELAKLKSEEERAIISMLQYEVISKRLPVQLTIVGKARKDYIVMTDDITIDPEAIVVIGPDSILERVNFARTIPIDISEYTRDIIKEIELAPIAKGITLKHSLVNVHIPIVKKEIDKSSE